MLDVGDGAFLGDVDVEAVGPEVPGSRLARADDAVLLGQVLLTEVLFPPCVWLDMFERGIIEVSQERAEGRSVCLWGTYAFAVVVIGDGLADQLCGPHLRGVLSACRGDGVDERHNGRSLKKN